MNSNMLSLKHVFKPKKHSQGASCFNSSISKDVLINQKPDKFWAKIASNCISSEMKQFLNDCHLEWFVGEKLISATTASTGTLHHGEK
jgi:hypothetical protein